MPCPKPEARYLDTNEDLIRFASEAIEKWEICSAQVEGLRKFFRENSEKDSQNSEKGSKNSEKDSE